MVSRIIQCVSAPLLKLNLVLRLKSFEKLLSISPIVSEDAIGQFIAMAALGKLVVIQIGENE
jgi:hypothetical protein